MKVSTEGQQIMHYFEACKLRAYPDPYSPLGKAMLAARYDLYGPIPPHLQNLSGAPWTIAWGETGPHVKQGMVVTQAEADALFAARLAREFEPQVDDVLQNPTTQEQFDAYVSLAYNIGMPNFRSSTVLRRHNLGDFVGAAQAILMWEKAGGVVSKGLQRRRAAERCRALGGRAAQAIAAAQAIK